jgi:hypothetical protein
MASLSEKAIIANPAERIKMKLAFSPGHIQVLYLQLHQVMLEMQ